MNNVRPLRGEDRFHILDGRLWAIECDGKRVPSKWINNLSPHGMGISMGMNSRLREDDTVHIKVVFAGRVLIDVKGRVKWVKSTDTINLNNFGIEFSHPLGTIPQRWKEMQVDDHVQVLHAS